MRNPMRRSGYRVALAFAIALIGADDTHAAETIELFNGRDLSGWVNVNGAPDTWAARDGMIVGTGHPRGFMRTEEMYENYILEVEWRHVTPGGNAGIMVHADALPQIGAPYPRSVEVQVQDGDHGSVFAIRECTLTPLTDPSPKNRARPIEKRANPAGEWNRYRLTSKDGSLELAVNGKTVTRATDCSQVKGYICLEAERSEIHFRNLRLTPLPGSNPPDDKIAQAARGFVPLFDGLTFDGWKTHPGFEGHWEAEDGVISCDGKAKAEEGGERNLWTDKEYENFVLIADWRLPRKPRRKPMNDFTEDGLLKHDENGDRVLHVIPHAGDSGIFLRGNVRAQVNIWSQPMGSGDINAYHKDASLPEAIRRACMPRINADRPAGEWNRFVITLRGDRVRVTLNRETVIDNARLPGIPRRGPIGLQNHGDPVQFRNLFIQSLP